MPGLESGVKPVSHGHPLIIFSVGGMDEETAGISVAPEMHSSGKMTTDIYAHLQEYDDDIDKF